MLPKPINPRRLAVILPILLAAGLVSLTLSFPKFIFEMRPPDLAAVWETESLRLRHFDVAAAVALPMTRSLVISGETAAWHDSKIYPRATGYIQNWLVDIGDSVTNGQTLALIETPELDAKLQAARAKLDVAAAEASARLANADFARNTYDRWLGSPAGLVSEQERQSKRTASIAADFESTAAKARVAVNQAEVDRLTSLTAFKEIKAPFDGIIVERNIDIGDLVTADNASEISAMFRIVRNKPLRVFVNVPQGAAHRLFVGDARARISIGGRYYEGALARTSPVIDRRSKTLRAEIDLSNTEARLLAGLDVQVELTLKIPPGVQIPRSALLYRPRPQVVVLKDKQMIEIRDVVVGLTADDVAEIHGGLEPGDKVILNPDDQIISGKNVSAHDSAVDISD